MLLRVKCAACLFKGRREKRSFLSQRKKLNLGSELTVSFHFASLFFLVLLKFIFINSNKKGTAKRSSFFLKSEAEIYDLLG